MMAHKQQNTTMENLYRRRRGQGDNSDRTRAIGAKAQNHEDADINMSERSSSLPLSHTTTTTTTTTTTATTTQQQQLHHHQAEVESTLKPTTTTNHPNNTTPDTHLSMCSNPSAVSAGSPTTTSSFIPSGSMVSSMGGPSFPNGGNKPTETTGHLIQEVEEGNTNQEDLEASSRGEHLATLRRREREQQHLLSNEADDKTPWITNNSAELGICCAESAQSATRREKANNTPITSDDDNDFETHSLQSDYDQDQQLQQEQGDATVEEDEEVAFQKKENFHDTGARVAFQKEDADRDDGVDFPHQPPGHEEEESTPPTLDDDMDVETHSFQSYQENQQQRDATVENEAVQNRQQDERTNHVDEFYLVGAGADDDYDFDDEHTPYRGRTPSDWGRSESEADAEGHRDDADTESPVPTTTLPRQLPPLRTQDRHTIALAHHELNTTQALHWDWAKTLYALGYSPWPWPSNVFPCMPSDVFPCIAHICDVDPGTRTVRSVQYVPWALRGVHSIHPELRQLYAVNPNSVLSGGLQFHLLCSFATSATSALWWTHRCLRAHNDVKCENFVFDSNTGFFVLIDWESSRPRDFHDDRTFNPSEVPLQFQSTICQNGQEEERIKCACNTVLAQGHDMIRLGTTLGEVIDVSATQYSPKQHEGATQLRRFANRLQDCGRTLCQTALNLHRSGRPVSSPKRSRLCAAIRQCHDLWEDVLTSFAQPSVRDDQQEGALYFCRRQLSEVGSVPLALSLVFDPVKRRKFWSLDQTA